MKLKLKKTALKVLTESESAMVSGGTLSPWDRWDITNYDCGYTQLGCGPSSANCPTAIGCAPPPTSSTMTGCTGTECGISTFPECNCTTPTQDVC